MKPHYWNQAVGDLSAKDPVMASLIKRFGTYDILERKSDPLTVLLRSVSGQQISVAAADSIWARLEQLVNPLNPKNLLAANDIALRGAGLSGSKVQYVKNIAEFIQQIPGDYWTQAAPEQIKQDLLNIKGVGEWTYQMFAIFYLQEPDIFPEKDIGILRAAGELYEVSYKTKTGMKKIRTLSRKWKPWNTVACWYLWMHLDNAPVNY